MSLELRLLLITFSICWFVIVSVLLKNEKIPVKYSLIWFLSALVIFVVGVFPNAFVSLISILGFQTISNMIIGIILTLLLIITIVLTIIISQQNKKIILLIQEVSLLKIKEFKNNEKK